jgi:hypothetical protein
LVQAFLKKWWVESDFKAPNLPDGKVESVNDKINSLHKGYLSIDAASLRSLGFNRSGPIALDVSNIFNISSTSFSE